MRRMFAMMPGLVTATLAGCLGGPPPPEPLNPVRFLLVSDLDAGRDADTTGGIARLATVRKRIAAEGPIVFAAAGNITRGANVTALNAAGLRYATFGSDELTLPADSLETLIRASKFVWLSANCALTGQDRLPNVRAWDTLRISTHKVGIFGLTFAGTFSVDTADTATFRCGNPASAARQMIDTLEAQGADLIVALTHQATSDDRDLLLSESRIGLVLGGRDSVAQTVAIAGRHVLKSGADAEHAQFVTLWGGKNDWRQAVALVPVDARLPRDSAVVHAQLNRGNKNPD